MKKYPFLLLACGLLCWLAWPAVGQMPAPAEAPAGVETAVAEREAAVFRDKHTKAARLEIYAPGPWELFAGPNPESVDLARPILTGERPGSFDLDVPAGRRAYFVIQTASGRRILSERLLPMSGGYNFRDLGGLKTNDGRALKWGRLFRTDDLKSLTQADLEYLASIPIVSVVDFRTYEERGKEPDRLPDSVVRHLFLPVSARALEGIKFAEAGSPEKERALRARAYEFFLTEEHNQAAWRAWFQALSDESQLPLIFHCSAGKDRTGLATALLLEILGVERAVIMADFLSSAAYLEGKYDRPEHGLVFEEYLETAFRLLDERYGSAEGYLKKEIGLDPDILRKNLLAAD